LDTISIDRRSKESQRSSEALLAKITSAWQLIDTVILSDENDRNTNNIVEANIWKRLRFRAVRFLHDVEEEEQLWKSKLTSWCQFQLLLIRYLTDFRRYRSALIALSMQTLLVASLTSLIFWQMDFSQSAIQNRIGLLFFIVVQQTFAVCIKHSSEDSYQYFCLQKSLVHVETAVWCTAYLIIFVVHNAINCGISHRKTNDAT
jgi:hypothetical protein